MKRIISIALLSFYLMTLIRVVFPYIDYFINKDYIASVLCENKDKPEKNCNGKCYLKKQIKKVQQEQPTDQNAPSSTKQIEKDQIYFSLEIPTNQVVFDFNNTAIAYVFAVKVQCLDVPNPPPQLFT